MAKKRNVCFYVAAAAVSAVTVAGGCSRCGTGDGGTVADTLSLQQQAEVLLTQGPEYSHDNLATLAARVRADEPLNVEQTAHAVVLCQGSVNRLQQELDQLQRNDDPADAFNVLSELARASWTADTRTLYNYLSKADTPLDKEEASRRLALTSAIMRINRTAAQIEETQLGGKRIFRL